MLTLVRPPRDLTLGLILSGVCFFAFAAGPSSASAVAAGLSVILVLVQSFSAYARRSAVRTQVATRTILDALPDAVFVIRANGEIEFSKDVMLPGKPVLPATSAAKPELLSELVEFAKGVAVTKAAEVRTITLADDHILECRASLFDSGQVLLIARDITEAHIVEERIRYLATHDQLTGLLNRSSFLQALDKAIARSNRSGKPVGLLFLDLNKFKAVNDTLGHAAGDELLKEVASRIQGCLRTTDTAFRLAGDEFTVIVEQLDAGEDVHLIAAKLRDRLSAPYFEDPAAPKVSASIGAVAYPCDGASAEELLHLADKAMYQDKAQGRK